MSSPHAPPPPPAASGGQPRDTDRNLTRQPHSTATANPAPTVAGGRVNQPATRAMPTCRSSGHRQRVRRARIDAIICDVDDVVIDFDPGVSADIEKQHSLPNGALLETLLHWPTAQLASVGAISYPRWLRYARQTVSGPAVQQWLDDHGSLNHQVVDTLNAAKQADVRLYLLCNSTTTKLTGDLAYHAIGELADHVYCSADLGYAKPDPRAYQHVLNAASLHPARTLYIDDNPAWVQTGRELGMRTHLYRGADQLAYALTRQTTREHP